MRTLCCQDTYSKHWIKSLDQHRIYTRLSPACRRVHHSQRTCGAPVAGPWPSAEGSDTLALYERRPPTGSDFSEPPRVPGLHRPSSQHRHDSPLSAPYHVPRPPARRCCVSTAVHGWKSACVTVVCVNWRCLRLDGPEVSMSCLTCPARMQQAQGGQVGSDGRVQPGQQTLPSPDWQWTHPSIAWVCQFSAGKTPEVIK
jgi:hypothetical protein